MNQRRTLILVAAIVVGALSSFLVWNYVNGVEDTALDNAEQVPVYLVKESVTRGTDGRTASAFIAKETIPKKFKPGNAITDLEDIAGKIARNDLVPNQVVVTDMFVEASDPAARASFSERLAQIRGSDQVAVTLSLDEVRGVAGLIQPGDYVNVMVTEVSQVGTTGEDGAPAPTQSDVLFGQQARFLYQKVEVLAIGQQAVPEAGATAEAAAAGTPAAPIPNSGLITFIVPSKAAQYLASVPSSQIYLVLVARDYKPVAQEAISLSDLLPGEDPSQLTPYGKDGPESGS